MNRTGYSKNSKPYSNKHVESDPEKKNEIKGYVTIIKRYSMNERENIKLEYQKLFNSIKATRTQHQNEFNELIEHVNQKKYVYADVRAQNQDLLITISELKNKLQTVDKGKNVNTKFDKFETSGTLLCVTPMPKNIAVKAKKVSNTKVNTDRDSMGFTFILVVFTVGHHYNAGYNWKLKIVCWEVTSLVMLMLLLFEHGFGCHDQFSAGMYVGISILSGSLKLHSWWKTWRLIILAEDDLVLYDGYEAPMIVLPEQVLNFMIFMISAY
ncbi:hypothetical protein Tco_1467395 [Tanacetum coccineum]